MDALYKRLCEKRAVQKLRAESLQDPTPFWLFFVFFFLYNSFYNTL